MLNELVVAILTNLLKLVDILEGSKEFILEYFFYNYWKDNRCVSEELVKNVISNTEIELQMNWEQWVHFRSFHRKKFLALKIVIS